MKPTALVQAVTLQAAKSLHDAHEEIPQARLARLIGRTIMGGLIGLIGLGVIAMLVATPVWLAYKAQDAAKIPIVLVTFGLGAGLGLLVWGALIMSSELAGKPLALAVATFKGVYRTVRPEKK